MLRKMGIIAILSLIVTALAAVPAFADIILPQNPTVDASGNLTVSFTEEIPDPIFAIAQIPLSYTLNGTSEATYICLKKNGRAPKGGPVPAGTVSQTVNVQDIFFASLVEDEFGTPIASSVSGSFTVSPPPPTGLSCPTNGLKLFPSSVTYNGLVLVNESYPSPDLVIGGPISRTF